MPWVQVLQRLSWSLPCGAASRLCLYRYFCRHLRGWLWRRRFSCDSLFGLCLGGSSFCSRSLFHRRFGTVQPWWPLPLTVPAPLQGPSSMPAPDRPSIWRVQRALVRRRRCSSNRRRRNCLGRCYILRTRSFLDRPQCEQPPHQCGKNDNGTYDNQQRRSHDFLPETALNSTRQVKQIFARKQKRKSPGRFTLHFTPADVATVKAGREIQSPQSPRTRCAVLRSHYDPIAVTLSTRPPSATNWPSSSAVPA